ncbi:hypothetical protein AKJ09_02527 [Labilithrix luteola]|uniref:Lipoprotein n=1 Tax=Labilithrix luteola TaxID=1391654 RepID=A0A0K1PQQ7_9BACT|nr:hypothetical protein [Labilithrix luteola]AKU95863.1 hypothetical protein AKJ09_02527 [Labilithrix luteola]
MRSLFVTGLLFSTFTLACLACGSSKPKDTRFPAREPGCDVQVFPEAPTVPTENIGTVSAICSDDISTQDCLRTLKDEACKLGADVVWGVSDEPAHSDTKKKLAGRAAHTKAAK